ncbi:hypothetical protein DFP96_104288 [Listeria rocourtiae]|uniref:Uncharacterized protein n=1 Tax=Listeria rocourtiae TaxID=647910 RepID=A0A4R6ZND7_9LIST|nr:hypothetical protein DFP96_104288 [Listeria rocourtiae]
MISALLNIFFCGHEDENGEIKLTKGTKFWLLLFSSGVLLAFILIITMTVLNYRM